MPPAATRPRAPCIRSSGAARASEGRGARREGASGAVALRRPRPRPRPTAHSPARGSARAPGGRSREHRKRTPRPAASSLAPSLLWVPESSALPGIQLALYKCRFLFPIHSLLHPWALIPPWLSFDFSHFLPPSLFIFCSRCLSARPPHSFLSPSFLSPCHFPSLRICLYHCLPYLSHRLSMSL